MTCVGCRECRLRFSKAASIYLATCPDCGREPEVMLSLEQVVGFQLIDLQPPAPDMGAAAAAISLPVPALPGRRT